MIAVDTNVLVAYLNGSTSREVDLLDNALADKRVLLPPVVVTEVLSAPNLSREFILLIKEIPMVELHEGFWHRAGLLRAVILAKGFKARVADALIAQACIDEDLGLLTADRDFRHFARYCGLKLL